jgi:hypothetical protein
LASANTGQTVTISGSGLKVTSDILLEWTDVSGELRVVVLNPVSASPDGTTADVVVPAFANGAPRLRMFGSSTAPVLQIVPTLAAFNITDRVILFGSGLVEGGGAYQFAGVTITDLPADSNSMDVWYSTGSTFENGSVYINRTALPRHGLGNVSVTTAGGTSAPLALNTIRVSVDGVALGDVAVDASGKVWTSDYDNPGKLLRIEPTTGAVISSIDYGAGFGLPYSYNYAGLQVLPAAMSLAGVTVPAGSLLLFNGYPNRDIVLAINADTGAVISSLVLAGNYDLTSGVYDPTTERLFVSETNGPGNRLMQVNPATGELEAAITVPLNWRSHAGIAISPLSGNLWIGSSGGTEVVEITRTGVEVRRINLAGQGVDDDEISGLSFLPDGKMLVSSTQGTLFAIAVP